MINAGLKIGILTYTREYSNLGTVMQCYCTLQAIRAAYPGAQVELIDYATRTAWRRPYLSHASLRSLRCDAVRFRKYDQFFAKELNFSAHQLVTRNLSQACAFISRQHYDAIYVGSDTVLELRDADKNGCTAYWLSPDIPGRKFLTAASSHKLVFEQLSDDQKRSIQRAVEGFCLLGLRDEATLRLVEHFAGKGDRRIRLVPDPTFTYPIDPRPIEKYLEHRQLPSDRPMVCLHLLRNSVWAATLAQYFRRAGYLVASLRPAQYADIVFTDLSPFEQMGLYRYFKLVITHRFHDVIFCLKSLTPVLAFPEYPDDVTMYGESKLYTLLKSFELDRVHYLDGMLEINAERLFDIHDEAITSFQRRSECTAAIAARRKVEYEAFIAESRRCVA